MRIDVKVPSVGESIKEAVLAQWYAEDGAAVRKEAPLFVIETDKVTLEVTAEADGILQIKVPAGETVPVGAVVGAIETTAAQAAETPGKADTAETDRAGGAESDVPPEKSVPQAPPKKLSETWDMGEAAQAGRPAETAGASEKEDGAAAPIYPPSVRRLAALKGIDPAVVTGTGPGGRVTKGDLIAYLESRPPEAAGGKASAAPGPPAESAQAAPGSTKAATPEETTRRTPMSPIRRRIAARLLEARRNTAMLTTFNDVDMSALMAMRAEYKEAFKKKHDVSLGMMSFFIKASVAALGEFPAINAFIEGDDIVYHDYCHIGVAVGSDRGLVVPVIRHADRLSFAAIEQAIVDYVVKIKQNRLELSDMEGGTFTLTNGGVFGSLLSTPILNTPQSAILGMHRIDKRPVVIDDAIEIRPMMYLALSYDHRIVDGREAVTFLRRIKECVEKPERMLLEM